MLRLKSYSDGHNNENEPSEPTSPTPYPSRSPTLSHSHWPLPHLDAILERSESRSLRSSASAPKLRGSPQRSPKVVKPQDSIHSIHPQRSEPTPWPVKQSLPAAKMNNYKSLSAPDLDCVENFFISPCSSGSSSSSQALQDIPINPAGPARPIVEPPERRPTPEGLPSFGSNEAQELRLHPEPAFKRGARALAHWIRGERETSNEVVSKGSPNAVSPTAPASPTMQDRSVPMDMLQRLFGAARVVEADPDQSANPRPRAALPRGISIADSPGALTTAEDGTFVRGRFGARMSAHSVGSRPLSQHPFVRGVSEQKIRSDRSRTGIGSTRTDSRAEATGSLLRDREPSQLQRSWRDQASQPSSVVSPRTRILGTYPGSPPASINALEMREPENYPPSLHDRTDDSSRNREGPDVWGVVGIDGRNSSGLRRQQEIIESEDGCWHQYCLCCCDHDTNQTQEENELRRQLTQTEKSRDFERRNREEEITRGLWAGMGGAVAGGAAAGC